MALSTFRDEVEQETDDECEQSQLEIAGGRFWINLSSYPYKVKFISVSS